MVLSMAEGMGDTGKTYESCTYMFKLARVLSERKRQCTSKLKGTTANAQTNVCYYYQEVENGILHEKSIFSPVLRYCSGITM